MKKKKLIIFAILIVGITLMLASCSSVTNFMSPIVNSIIDNTDDAHNLTYANITLENDEYTYDGTAFAPAITKVEVVSQEVDPAHYTVSYANNTDAGQATVSITAQGETYIGSQSTTFTINPKQLTEVTGKLSAVHTYTGAEITPKISDLKDQNVALTESDYEIAYKDNINVSDKAAITVTGKGNYAGSVYFEFSITPLTLDGAMVTLNRTTYSYTGQEHQPTVVKITKDGLDYFIPSDNFNITYTENIEAGTGNVLVEGINNCQGQTTALFEITTEVVFKITFAAVGDIQLDSVFAPADGKISKPIVTGDKYHDINWYTDDSFSLDKRFFFDKMPSQNITLYGRWEQELDIKFFAYENATPDLSIDSFTELVNLLEYISFNQIVESDEQEFYTMNYEYDNLTDELSNAWKQITYPTTTGYGHTSTEENGKHKVKLYLASQEKNIFEPTIQAPDATATQYSSFNTITTTPTRTQDFDDFYIEQGTQSYAVSSSNQLFYLLENGLKPSPITGSAAESIYAQAKEILRQIITDDMSDYDKAMAIYQWLICNITYDYSITSIEQENWVMYRSFYLEGVFFDKIAVCDGISKAYVVLCQMEGIPCVRVTGYADLEENGHAWNKVKINGQWFIVDATWGNGNVKNLDDTTIEYLTYQDFMISDVDKKETFDCHALSYTYQGIASTGTNLYYENYEFVYNEKNYDFVIDSQEELNILVQYCASADQIANYTINFIIIFDYGEKFDDELTAALLTIGNYDFETVFVISHYDKANITLIFR